MQDLLTQMLQEVAEDLNYILDNLTEDIVNHPDKAELHKAIRKIDFATFVLSCELCPPVESEQLNKE